MSQRRRKLAVAALVVAFLLNPLRWVLVGPGGSEPLEGPRTDLEQALEWSLLVLSSVLFGVGIWLVARSDS